MYFNDKPKETNYDSEFSKKINFLNFKLLAIIGIVIFIIIIMIIIFLINKKEYFIKLNGETDIVLYVGNDYVEPGYVAYDSKGKEYDASLVTIDGAVNPNMAGEYVLTYKFKEKSAERIVTVLSKQDKVTILGLYGDTIIFVPLGQEFKEPGYYAIDSDYSNEEIKNKVDVSGEVNINKVGTYHIIYKLENDMGITITKERIVIVTSADFALEYEPKTLTNKNVKIYGYITNNYFDYILLPNGKKENNRNFSYIVDKNGKYTFKVFLKDGTNHDETVDISNIDTTKPTGICAAVVKNSTTIEVNAQDDKEILGYRYKLDGYSTGVIGKNSYTYSGTTQNVSVEVHDKAGNVTNITCNVKIEQSSVIPSPPSQGPVPSVISPSSKSYDGNRPYISCNGDRTRYNNDLNLLVNSYGRKKRYTAVRVASYISQEMDVRIPYFWAGGHWHFSWDGHSDPEKFRGISPQWGCITKNYKVFEPLGTDMLPAGFDCTGFVAWVLFNTGFSKDEIGTFSGESALSSLGGKRLTVINFAGSTGNIKAGDVVWRTGHMGFVIDVSGNIATIAHAKGTLYGLVVEKYNTDTGKLVGGGANFMKVSKMDNYYIG